MANEPPRPVALPSPPRLPLLEDPPHPGLFIVRRIGTLTLLLIAGLCVAILLAGSLVRLDVPVQGGGPARVESVTLATYLTRQLERWRPPGLGGAAP